MMTALISDRILISGKQKAIYKHRFLKHPCVLFPRSVLFLAVFSLALVRLPTLPNPDIRLFFLAVVLLLPVSYLFHKKRGAFMEWGLPRGKYSAVIAKGHDYLYRIALLGVNGGMDHTPGAVRRLRMAYAIAEGASMITFAISLASLAIVIMTSSGLIKL